MEKVIISVVGKDSVGIIAMYVPILHRQELMY